MKLDGRLLASEIFDRQKKEVERIKKNGITPHLAVLLVGDDPASHAYVKQKKLKGETIGINVTILEFPSDVQEETLLTEVKRLNTDTTVHGIVIQQPLPKHLNPHVLVEATDPQKDVDGFHSRSGFTPPIAEAVVELLKQAATLEKASDFNSWIKVQSVTVIGKGETGGKPIIEKMRKLGIEPAIIDSKTTDPDTITKKSDIIVSCVGRPLILRSGKIKPGAILLSIGMYRGEDGKLHGDYEENDIKEIASYYTPVPGGVGPVNVAMLLHNVLIASEI